MPRPPGSSPATGFADGWFALVPAYRLATFRTAIAVTTIAFHVPKFNGLMNAYLASAFHVPPAFGWLPLPTAMAGAALAVLQCAAAGGLLLGLGSRTCAWFLAGAGFYVMLLDPEHYSHNAHFHLTLLALVGCSSDRVSLWRLLRDRDAAARCPAWPERLVRLQVSIVFFYAALDKVFSPFWGVSGARLSSLHVANHGLGLAAFQRANRAVMRAAPGLLSLATIAVEFFLAMAFAVRALWRAGLVVGFGFVVYLEFLVRPGVFTWDMLAAGFVFLPAGDQSWRVPYDPRCRSCRWNRAVLPCLDWLRRLQWVPIELPPPAETASASARERIRVGLHLVSPRGRSFSGLDAVRVLPAALPGPLFVAMALIRFSGGYLAGRGYGPWDDLPFVMLAAYAALWVPAVARYVGPPQHAVARTRCAHQRTPRILDPPRPAG